MKKQNQLQESFTYMCVLFQGTSIDKMFGVLFWLLSILVFLRVYQFLIMICN